GMVQMPPKSYLYYPEHNGDLRSMPAFLEADDITGVKIVNVHPDNPQKGLPTVMATVLLNSTETGAPLAIMGGTYLTDMRTGAAGGVAAKYLARADSNVLGLVGAGRQARTQALAVLENFDIDTIKVVSNHIQKSEQFKKYVEPICGCDAIVKNSIEAVCDCDILVTTTPVRKPIVKSEWVNAGTHINAIGADAKGKEELDPLILKRAKIVIDDIRQAAHSGEINVPISEGIITQDNIYANLGEIVSGKKLGRTSDSEITVFDSTGLAIQDISTANLVFNKAKEAGIGTWLEQF
ncbi:MAG: alanine dehydrogenase, partial [Methanosarcinales archaeon]|nr:alanine dehydrogenase [Methanosarcinales archaeon]